MSRRSNTDFSFVDHFYKPDSPEQKLIATILDTYFIDINNVHNLRKLRKDRQDTLQLNRLRSLGSSEITLSMIKSHVSNAVTAEYCDLLDISHDYFLKTIDRYLQYKLNIKLSDI